MCWLVSPLHGSPPACPASPGERVPLALLSTLALIAAIALLAPLPVEAGQAGSGLTSTASGPRGVIEGLRRFFIL